MAIGVDFILKASTDGFTTGVAAAENSLKGLKSELKQFGGGRLSSLIGIAGIIQGFRGALQAAQDLREESEKLGAPISAATRSVAAYADSIDSLKSGMKEVAVLSLGFFTLAGEGWGSLVNRIMGVSRAQEKLAEQTAKDADLAEKNLAKSRADNSAEKMLAAEEKLAEMRRKNLVATLDGQAKVNALQEDYNRLMNEAGEIPAKTVAHVEKLQEAETKRAELANAQAKLEKQQLEDFTRADADSQRQADEWTEQQIKFQEERYGAQKKVTEAVVETTEAIKTQAQVEADATAEFIAGKNKEAASMRSILGVRNGSDLTDASSAELKDLIAKNRVKERELGARSGPTYGSLSSGTNLGSPEEQARLAAERVNAQRELDFRSKTLQNVGIGGEDYARRMFKGDPLNFDSVLDQLRSAGGGLGQDEKVKAAIVRIDDTLANALGRK